VLVACCWLGGGEGVKVTEGYGTGLRDENNKREREVFKDRVRSDR
jgi:hypothetical protein